MKRFMICTVFAAASWAPLAISANAQTLTAEIPFAFRAGSTGMSAGNYEVGLVSHAANHIVLVKNTQTKQTVLIGNVAGTDPMKTWRAAGTPKLAFECVENRCVLREIWTGDGPALKINSPKPGPDEAIRLTEIRMTRSPAF